MRHPDEQEPGVTQSDAAHPDEGTIHAWLDGALAPAEAAALERHVAACAPCAAAVAEARGFVAAASRILGALDAVPGDVIPVPHTVAPTPAAPDAGAPPADGRAPLRLERGGGGGAPVAHRRRRWSGWPVSAAAVALLAVGTWTVARENGGLERAVQSAAEGAAVGEAMDAATVAPEKAGRRGPAVEAPAAPSVSGGASVPEVAPGAAGSADLTAAASSADRAAGTASAAADASPHAAPGAALERRSRVDGVDDAAAMPGVVRGAPPAAKIAVDSALRGASPFAAARPTPTASAAENEPAPPPPPPPPSPLVVAPSPERRSSVVPPAAPPVAARLEGVVATAQSARTLVGCYRVELERAPTGADARLVERTLPGWIRLTSTPAAEPDWLVAAPTTAAPGDDVSRSLAEPQGRAAAAAPASAAGPRWRERTDGGTEVEWPAVGGPLRLELRSRGDGLAGTATLTGADAAVPLTLRAAACAAPATR